MLLSLKASKTLLAICQLEVHEGELTILTK